MRIVIGEDSVLFREGLAALLADSGHDIVAKADDAPGVIREVDTHRPDLVIIDVRMPPDLTDDGARSAKQIRHRHPELGIVLLSQHIETRHSVELVAGGRFGYLLKDRILDVDDFLDALHRVARGGSALDPEVVTRLIEGQRRSGPMNSLTNRERDVLTLMAQGRTQPRHRPPVMAHRPHRGNPRRQHPSQTRPHRHQRRPPPGHGRPHLPQPPSSRDNLTTHKDPRGLRQLQ